MRRMRRQAQAHGPYRRTQSPDHSAPSLAPSPYRTQPRDAHDNFRNGATSRLTRPQETCIYTLRIRAASCTPVIWRSSIIDAGSSMSSERAVSRSLKPETLRGESWSHDCCIRQSRVVVGVRPECRADINLQGLVLSLRNHQSSSPTSLGVRDARSPVRRADCHNGDCMSAAEPDVWAVGGRLLRTAAWQTVRPGPSRDWTHRPPPAGCTLERAVTALSAVVVILASALSISPVDIDDLLSPFPPISPFPHFSSPTLFPARLSHTPTAEPPKPVESLADSVYLHISHFPRRHNYHLPSVTPRVDDDSPPPWVTNPLS